MNRKKRPVRGGPGGRAVSEAENPTSDPILSQVGRPVKSLPHATIESPPPANRYYASEVWQIENDFVCRLWRISGTKFGLITAVCPDGRVMCLGELDGMGWVVLRERLKAKGAIRRDLRVWFDKEELIAWARGRKEAVGE